MGKNNGNPNKERNQHLYKISKSITDIANSKNEKWALRLSISSVIISFLAIAIAIIVPFIEYHLDKVNKPLLFDKNVSIVPEELNDVIITFDIKQGGIKKVYLAFKEKSGIIYKNMVENLDSDSLVIHIESGDEEVDTSKKEIFINDNKKEKILLDGHIKMIEIEDFSLVLLDTTGQWWIYYFITSPQIIPDGLEYDFDVKADDGKTIVSEQFSLDKQDMDYVMLDGTLTSELSIEKSLQDLETDYKLISERRKIKGENGEIFEFQPKIENIYTPPKAEDIYKDIITIRDDINTLSLNQ
jgi:hypothetical protein